MPRLRQPLRAVRPRPRGPALASVEPLGLLEPLPVLDRSQRQQLVDHLRQPFALRADAGDEARAVVRRASAAVHPHARAARRCRGSPRAGFSFRGSGCARTARRTACPPAASRMVSSARPRSPNSPAAPGGGARSPAVTACGIAAQRADLARQPPRRQQSDHQRRAQQHPAPAQDRVLAARDERRDARGWAWRRSARR